MECKINKDFPISELVSQRKRIEEIERSQEHLKLRFNILKRESQQDSLDIATGKSEETKKEIVEKIIIKVFKFAIIKLK